MQVPSTSGTVVQHSWTMRETVLQRDQGSRSRDSILPRNEGNLAANLQYFDEVCPQSVTLPMHIYIARRNFTMWTTRCIALHFTLMLLLDHLQCTTLFWTLIFTIFYRHQPIVSLQTCVNIHFLVFFIACFSFPHLHSCYLPELRGILVLA